MARMKSKNNQRGVAIVELAIVMPVLILMTLGLIEYGWMFLKAQQITNAARQGARIGATVDAGAAEVGAAVSNAMNTAGLSASGYQVTVTPADVAGLELGETFTVNVTVIYADIGLDMPLVPTPMTLQSTVSMVKEGL